jgi:hypothetical protein
MGLEFIHRVIKTSLVLSALGFLFITVYYHFRFGGGILVGAIWGCLNLLFLTNLISEIFSPGKKVIKGKVIRIALVKFPLLYAAGYVLLAIKYFPAESLLLGFTLIFLVMFLKALGRWVLSLNPSERPKAQCVEGPGGQDAGQTKERDRSRLVASRRIGDPR